MQNRPSRLGDGFYVHRAVVELQCKLQNKQGVLLLITDLREQVDKIINGLAILEQADTLAQPDDSYLQGQDAGRLRGLLEQLEEYLESDLAEAQDCLLALGGYVRGGDLNAGFMKLESAMSHYDIDTAKQSIQDLKKRLAA